MTGSGHRPVVSRSPLELIAIVVAIVAMAGLGLLWGVGIVVGSMLGSVLPGEGGEGMAAVIRNLPDIGQAWQPAIPSWAVWMGAVGLVGVFGPLAWRLARSAGLSDEGAAWATGHDLRRAGLLVVDQLLAHAEAEEIRNAS